MTLFTFTLITLAAYRVATDLAWEDGPFEAFAWVRGQAHMRLGPLHWITAGVSCPICVGFWTAPVMLLIWGAAPWLVIWIAVAGAVALLARLK